MLNGNRDVVPWKEAIIDATIVAFYAAVASLVALGFPPSVEIAYVTGLAGLISFFGSLMAWRKIRQPPKLTPEELPLHRL